MRCRSFAPYHEAWTAGDYEQAISLLDGRLEVEVPVNAYPTKESFARALTTFGSMVRRVEMPAAMGSGDEAMLLYDLHSDGLGDLRVAEHFTVDAGRITRLRQIHDTAAVRAAGLPAPRSGHRDRTLPREREVALQRRDRA